MEQWKIYVCVWLDGVGLWKSIVDPYKGFSPGWSQNVTYYNEVNILQTCNSSSSLVYSHRRERIIFLSAANVTFAGRRMVSEESSAHEEEFWLCDWCKFSYYAHHFPAQSEMQNKGKKLIKIKNFVDIEASCLKNA